MGTEKLAKEQKIFIDDIQNSLLINSQTYDMLAGVVFKTSFELDISQQQPIREGAVNRKIEKSEWYIYWQLNS